MSEHIVRQTRQKDAIRDALNGCDEFISAQELHRKLEDRGESDMFATILQLAVQFLRGDEFVAAVQRVADGVFLAGLPHDMFTHYL